MNSFTPTARSKVKRLHERGFYDEATVYQILDASLLAHIAYVIDGQPFVTPTAFWRRGRVLYWHGSSASRMIRRQAEGIPVCVTVSHIDGLVLARSAFHHSINYRAVMAFGRTRLIDDPEEKEAELEFFMERLMPGRYATLRETHAQEIKATGVIAMEIEEASAKVRAKPPVDDEEDYALDIWAGVLPIRQVLGEFQADPRLKPNVDLPAHLRSLTSGEAFDSVLSRHAQAQQALAAE